MNLAAALAQATADLELNLPGAAQRRLLDYLALLQKWNRVYRLSGVRDPEQMLTHHLLDALAVVPHVRARTILDVGSGAGVPGIPLAIACPAARVTLLDSSDKKAGFMRQAAIELELENVEVVQERVEQWDSGREFELVITRAFSEIAEFVRLAGRLCQRGGMLAAMKGQYPREELARVPSPFHVRQVVLLRVPRLKGARHLVLLDRLG